MITLHLANSDDHPRLLRKCVLTFLEFFYSLQFKNVCLTRFIVKIIEWECKIYKKKKNAI